MTFRSLFVGDDGRLRALWRIVVFCFATFVALQAAELFAGPIFSGVFSLFGIRGVTNAYWVELTGVLGGTAITLHYVDRRPWSDVWLGRDAARPSLLIVGFLIGAAAIGVPILGLIGTHWLRSEGGGAGSWAGAALRISLLLLPAAFFEELISRGYILSVLREAWGWVWAVVATSVGFSLLHIMNEGASVESLTLVMLAGLFLAAVLVATRSLYAAWMAHFAWNWTMAVVFHTAVSGYPLESPGYRYVDAGPDWATGGDWGPEGGIPAGLGMVGGAGLAFLLARRARWFATASSDARRSAVNPIPE